MMWTDYLQPILLEAAAMFTRMAPWLAVGLLVAGVIHVLVPTALITRHLGRPGMSSVFRAALLGIPLPICSCGVLPLSAALKRQGATPGATVSFLVTTPTTGVDSILATGSLLGWFLALVRVIAATVIGIAAGAAVTLLSATAPASTTPPPPPVDDPVNSGPRTARLRTALTYGFGELLGSISRPLLIGTLLAGVITVFLPDAFFTDRIGDGFLIYLVMMLIGLPMYVCATGSLPLAAAFLLKGVPPGAVVVFLIAGPATNLATTLVIARLLGSRITAIYVATIAVGAILFGLLIDALIEFFQASVRITEAVHLHPDAGFSLPIRITAMLLGAGVVLHVLAQLTRRWRRPTSAASCCASAASSTGTCCDTALPEPPPAPCCCAHSAKPPGDDEAPRSN